MAIELVSKDGAKLLRLVDTVDITQAAELRNLLIEAFESAQRVEVDLSAAASVDITAVQLLWAAQRHALAHKAEFLWVGAPGTEIEMSLAAAGISPFWQCENAQSATGSFDGHNR
jgi:anti-anti-sigma regulatory factor